MPVRAIARRSTLLAVAAAALLSAATIATSGEDFGVTVEYSLSPKAAAKMAAMKEKIQAHALWYGTPIKAFQKEADKLMGRLYVGDETILAPGTPGRVVFTAQSVKTQGIAKLQGRAVSFELISASARFGGPDNILNCGHYEDTLQAARAQPIKIHCKLNEEE